MPLGSVYTGKEKIVSAVVRGKLLLVVEPGNPRPYPSREVMFLFSSAFGHQYFSDVQFPVRPRERPWQSVRPPTRSTPLEGQRELEQLRDLTEGPSV